MQFTLSKKPSSLWSYWPRSEQRLCAEKRKAESAWEMRRNKQKEDFFLCLQTEQRYLYVPERAVTDM